MFLADTCPQFSDGGKVFTALLRRNGARDSFLYASTYDLSTSPLTARLTHEIKQRPPTPRASFASSASLCCSARDPDDSLRGQAALDEAGRRSAGVSVWGSGRGAPAKTDAARTAGAHQRSLGSPGVEEPGGCQSGRGAVDGQPRPYAPGIRHKLSYHLRGAGAPIPSFPQYTQGTRI